MPALALPPRRLPCVPRGATGTGKRIAKRQLRVRHVMSASNRKLAEAHVCRRRLMISSTRNARPFARGPYAICACAEHASVVEAVHQ